MKSGVKFPREKNEFCPGPKINSETGIAKGAQGLVAFSWDQHRCAVRLSLAKLIYTVLINVIYFTRIKAWQNLNICMLVIYISKNGVHNLTSHKMVVYHVM